jgi:hypothetical protein
MNGVTQSVRMVEEAIGDALDMPGADVYHLNFGEEQVARPKSAFVVAVEAGSCVVGNSGKIMTAKFFEQYGSTPEARTLLGAMEAEYKDCEPLPRVTGDFTSEIYEMHDLVDWLDDIKDDTLFGQISLGAVSLIGMIRDEVQRSSRHTLGFMPGMPGAMDDMMSPSRSMDRTVSDESNDTAKAQNLITSGNSIAFLSDPQIVKIRQATQGGTNIWMGNWTRREADALRSRMIMTDDAIVRDLAILHDGTFSYTVGLSETFDPTVMTNADALEQETGMYDLDVADVQTFMDGIKKLTNQKPK